MATVGHFVFFFFKCFSIFCLHLLDSFDSMARPLIAAAPIDRSSRFFGVFFLFSLHFFFANLQRPMTWAGFFLLDRLLIRFSLKT